MRGSLGAPTILPSSRQETYITIPGGTAATGAGGASNEEPEERDKASFPRTPSKEDSELHALWVGVPLRLHPVFCLSFL